MERKVLVQNLSNGRVGYMIPSKNVRRTILANATIQVSFDEIEEGLYDYGIKALFSEGILKIVRHEDAVDLGLEVGQGIVQVVSVENSVILEKLKGPFTELQRFLKNASPTTLENVGILAVQHRIVEPGKVKIIEDYTGVNVLSALKRADDLSRAVEDIE